MIKNATIEFIGEIEEFINKDKKKSFKIAIDISAPSVPKTRYVIYENPIYSFDIIKNFKRGVYSVGDKIDFDFNPGTKNYYPTIWKIYNHSKTIK